MKLEKDRLIAKVENLDANLAQIQDTDGGAAATRKSDASHLDLGGSPGKTQVSSISKKGPVAASPGKYSQAEGFGVSGK